MPDQPMPQPGQPQPQEAPPQDGGGGGGGLKELVANINSGLDMLMKIIEQASPDDAGQLSQVIAAYQQFAQSLGGPAGGGLKGPHGGQAQGPVANEAGAANVRPAL